MKDVTKCYNLDCDDYSEVHRQNCCYTEANVINCMAFVSKDVYLCSSSLRKQKEKKLRLKTNKGKIIRTTFTITKMLVEAGCNNKPVTSEEIANKVGLSRITIHKYLKEMKKYFTLCWLPEKKGGKFGGSTPRKYWVESK